MSVFYIYVLLIAVVVLITLIDIFKLRRAAYWYLVILLFPVLGSILYFFVCTVRGRRSSGNRWPQEDECDGDRNRHDRWV